MKEYINTHLRQAEADIREGQLASAHIALKRVLRRDPRNTDALILEADVCLRQGHRTDCEDIVATLADTDLGRLSPAQKRRLGGICTQIHLYTLALQLFDQGREKGKTDPNALYQEGVCLRRIGHLEGAEQALLQCLRKRPKATAPYMQLGHVLKSMGNTKRAANYYRKFIELTKTETGTGYWCLADIKSYEFSDAEIDAIHEALSTMSGNLAQTSALYFALGAVAEKKQDYAKAVEYYGKGNELQGKLAPFDAAQYAGIIKGLKTVTGAAAVEAERQRPRPILIVGLPRTGTTLIEHILASHSRVQATDELPYLEKIALRLEMHGGYTSRLLGMTADETKMLARQYENGARQYLREDPDYFIDKYPGNFLHVGLVKRMMPQSIIIDARRDPRDVAVSAYRQLFNSRNEFASSFDGIYDYYKGYLEIMDHWQAVYPGQVRTVQYERLVSSPEEEIRGLLGFCGLEEERACLEFHKQKRAVLTPSVSGVNKPMYTSSVGQWRNYEPYTGDSMSRLASLIAKDV